MIPSELDTARHQHTEAELLLRFILPVFDIELADRIADRIGVCLRQLGSALSIQTEHEPTAAEKKLDEALRRPSSGAGA